MFLKNNYCAYNIRFNACCTKYETNDMKAIFNQAIIGCAKYKHDLMPVGATELGILGI